MGKWGGAADAFTGGLTRLPQPLIISDRSGLKFPGEIFKHKRRT